MTYLRYSPELEEISPDEVETFEKIAQTFEQMGDKVAAKEGRAVRVSHAKATAALKGELIVADDIAPELAQGLAARPGRYETIIRFAQGPGEVLHDRISTHRGMAIKITGLDGETIPESDEPGVQDFVLEAGSTAFINANATTFLTNLRAGVSNAPVMSEGIKSAVSNVARVGEATLEAIGIQFKTLAFFGHPSVHPLSEAYYTQAPMRWGDYVAKVGVYPTQATIDRLTKIEIDASNDHDAFRSAMIDHFSELGAQFDLKVQLATDVASTPIEDSASEWPEAGNPYRAVARLILGPQRSQFRQFRAGSRNHVFQTRS